jgi:hypothetical protein
MRRFLLPAFVLVLAGAAAALVGFGSGRSTSEASAQPLAGLTPLQQRLVSGFARAAAEQRATLAPNARGAQPAQQKSALTGCPADRGANVHVNQNCLNLADPDLQGRGQAQNETGIAQDPNAPRRIVASANDYRRGDGNCYSEYSSDGGATWTYMPMPDAGGYDAAVNAIRVNPKGAFPPGGALFQLRFRARIP